MNQREATREQIASFMASQEVWRERDAQQREQERAELTRWLNYKAARDREQEEARQHRR